MRLIIVPPLKGSAWISWISWLPWMLLLVSCSTPSKLPTVDGSLKRPANTAMAVELQSCKADLQNTRLRLLDSERLREQAATEQRRLDLLRELIAKLHSLPHPAGGPAFSADAARAAAANTLVTVQFEYGSTRVEIPPAAARSLLSETKNSPLILLRGRTDGRTDNGSDVVAEGRIAQARATAVANYLVAAGVDPKRIRITYQPIGDHVTENHSAHGRALNRRVEIEIYRTPPLALIDADNTTAILH